MISLGYASTGVAMLRLASQRLKIVVLMRVMIIVMEVKSLSRKCSKLQGSRDCVIK